MPDIAVFRVSRNKKKKSKLFLIAALIAVTVMIIYLNRFTISYIDLFNIKDIKSII